MPPKIPDWFAAKRHAFFSLLARQRVRDSCHFAGAPPALGGQLSHRFAGRCRPLGGLPRHASQCRIRSKRHTTDERSPLWMPTAESVQLSPRAFPGWRVHFPPSPLVHRRMIWLLINFRNLTREATQNEFDVQLTSWCSPTRLSLAASTLQTALMMSFGNWNWFPERDTATFH